LVFTNAKPGTLVEVKIVKDKPPEKGEQLNEWAKQDWHKGKVLSSTSDSITLGGYADDESLDSKVLTMGDYDGSWKTQEAEVAYVIKLYDPDHFDKVHVIDCKMADWGDWDACSCAKSLKGRKRWFLRTPRFGGLNCVELSTHEVAPCSCKGAEADGPVWCIPKEWGDWSPCSTSCGESGHRKRRRSYEVYKGDPNDILGAASKADPGLGQSLADTDALRTEYKKLDTESEQIADRHLQELILAFSTGVVAFVVLLGGFKLFGRFIRSSRHGYDTISEDAPATTVAAVIE
jgi:hypothetical protein